MLLSFRFGAVLVSTKTYLFYMQVVADLISKTVKITDKFNFNTELAFA